MKSIVNRATASASVSSDVSAEASTSLDFPRCLFYYQGFLYLCRDEADKSYFAESIRSMRSLRNFNYQTQHHDLYTLLDEHEQLLLLLAKDQIPNDRSLIESLIDSLELFHALKETHDCDVAQIQDRIMQFRRARIFHTLWTSIDDLYSVFLETKNENDTAWQRFHLKISVAISLAEQLSDTPVLLALLDIEGQLLTARTQGTQINSNVLAAFYQVFLELLHQFNQHHCQKDHRSEPLAQALSNLHQQCSTSTKP